MATRLLDKMKLFLSDIAADLTQRIILLPNWRIMGLNRSFNTAH